MLAGIAVLVTGTRWPTSSRRYRGARLADADEGAGHGARGRAASDRAIDDWDELSRGDDPTDDAVADPAGDVAAETTDASPDAGDRRRRRHPTHDDTLGGEGPTGPAARLAPETPQRRSIMSTEHADPGHGHSPAAWTSVTIMLIAVTIGTVAFFLDVVWLVWASRGAPPHRRDRRLGPRPRGYGVGGAKVAEKVH